MGEVETLALLDVAEYGCLSMTGVDGAPYGIPVNFVRDGNTLILHCAPEGRKIDNIIRNNRVSFCVVGKTEIQPAQFTTRYESAIVSGRAELIENAEHKTALLMKLCEKYTPDHLDAAKKAIAGSLHRTAVIVIHIESITGKAKR